MLRTSGRRAFTSADWRIFASQSFYSPAGRHVVARAVSVLWATCSPLRPGCLAIAWCVTLYAHASDTVTFDIPEQRADLALIEFAEQTDRTLFFSFDETNNKMANRLHGRYEVVKALELLLLGSGLSISTGTEGQLSVAQEPESNGETVVKKPRSLVARIGTVMTGVFVGSNAIAQSNNENSRTDGILDEIIVYAQKRAQNIQDVPISITALTSDDLDIFRMREPGDIAAQVPNLQNSGVVGDGVPVFSLRGISMNDFNFNQVSPVAVYVDEVYKGNPSFLSVPMFDLERVEVLRGPQGTLYGKNTTGGAVNFITKKPGKENEGYITVGVGNYSLFEAEAAFNLALSETLAVRLAGTWAEADGWFENVNSGLDDGSSVDQHAVRLSALWQPKENLEIILRASAAESTPTTWGTKLLVEQQPTWFGVYGLYSAFGGTPLTEPTQAGLDFFETSTDLDAERSLESEAVSLTIGWDISHQYTLTSITSWDDGEIFNITEADGAINRANENRYFTEAEQFTQELRLTSNLDGPFNFVTGLYYSDEQLNAATNIATFLDVDFNLDGGLDFNDCLDPLAVAFGFPPSAGGAATEALFNSLGFSLGGFATLGCGAANSFEQERASVAAYFDGNYAISDALTLRFGVRYTDDETDQKDFNGHRAGSDGTPVLGTINGGSLDPLASAGDLSFSDKETTYRIGLDYTLGNDTLLHVSYATGYRAGAFNGGAAGQPAERDFVEPEELDSFEIGFKSMLWGNRLRLNASAFHYSYENQQFVDVDTITFAQTLVNIEESELSGLEVEATLRVTPNFIASLGVGILDAEIKDGFLDGADVAGEPLPNGADLNANASIDWEMVATDLGRLTLHADATYLDEVSYDIGSGEADSYTLVNAGLSFVANDEQWAVSLWCKNIADEEYATWFGDFTQTIGHAAAIVGAPRTYGAELSYRF